MPTPGARSARVATLVVGTAVSSYGYLMTASADVGNGPFFAVQDALDVRTGLSLGAAAVVAGLALAVLAAMLRAPLGPGLLLIPVLTGMSVSVLEPLTPHVDALAVRWAMFGIGVVVMMLGAVVAIGAGFGTPGIDAAMFGIARVVRTEPARARIGLEITLAAIGFAFGGRVGPGTVVMAISVGPLFAFWTRRLGSMAAAEPLLEVRGLVADGR